MKAAFISFDFGEYSVRTASALAREADIKLFLRESELSKYASMIDPALETFAMPEPRLRHAFRQLRSMESLVRELRRFDPDVIHFQGGHFWFNLTLPFLGDIPLVLTVHEPFTHPGDRQSQMTPMSVLNLGYRRADHIIVHCNPVRDQMLAHYRKPADRVHLIPHILLGDDTLASDVAEEDGSVLFFGRIWAYKGLDYLIKAEPIITSNMPQARIVIAGQGEDFEKYRRMMVNPERFTVLNRYISDEERAVLFRRASVVVLPYIEASQSGVIPIAYRFRKPVVATATGGLPEMVEDGHTGFLVPPRDEAALAHAILKLLNDPALRRRYGANGRHKIDTECSGELVAEQTLQVYRQATRTATVADAIKVA